MTTALGEDTNAATVVEFFEDSIIHLALIYFGRNLELNTGESLCRTDLAVAVHDLAVFVDVLSACHLADSHTALERFLEAEFLRPMYLQDFRACRGIVDRGKHNQASNLEILALEIGAHTADEGGVVDGIGEVYHALGRPCAVQSSAHGQSTNVAGEPSNELSAHGFLGDEEADAALGLHTHDAHEDQRIDELQPWSDPPRSLSLDCTYLVCMRGGHEDDRAITRDLPRASRVHFSEEEVDKYREGPQQDVIDKVVHRRQDPGLRLAAGCRLFLRHDA